MAGMQWGVDSLAFIDGGGYSGCGTSGNLGWFVKNCWFAPDSIVFWGRYFTNADYPSGVWRNSESAAMVAVGINFLVAICQPGQGNIGTGDYNLGFSDGNTFCQNILNAAQSNSQIHLPCNCRIDVFLDVEVNTIIATEYWRGWATAVNQFQAPGGCFAPFYACAYLGSIGTGSGTTNCAQIASVNTAICYGIWSNEPQNVNGCSQSNGFCASPGPSWGPNNCSQYQTRLWQYGDAGVCQKTCWNNLVDLDSSNPVITGQCANDETDYLIHVF